MDQTVKQLDSYHVVSLAQWVADQAALIQQIPAPTFMEQRRAEYVRSRFVEMGLQEVSDDALYNVYGRLPGRYPALPALMVVAHTDTVFGPETDLSLRRVGDSLHGAGIGDNSMGVAGLLGALHYLTTRNLQLERDVWFVATSCEEGLGDLKGMRAAFERLQGQIAGVINLEGLALGHIYHAGIAVKRLHITAQTGGGHSWLHFGRPSAIHALMQLGSKISALKPPQRPRTTFNIGIVEGGTSINTIAPSAGMWLDLRSEQTDALTVLEREVRNLVNHMTTDEVRFRVEVVGDRPAGYLSPEHPLVQAAIESLGYVGMRAVLETGSTDGNVPLAAGCPTVTVGITRGGNAHRLDEYAEIAPIREGMIHLLMLLITAARADAGIV
ncbi:MAG: M20/M25/M40 family metallo-hydrolase [Anaerolineae bacterium]|nr:M20/M25/M40 family metallo-hydrolase [Anaerolineae bacterium]